MYTIGIDIGGMSIKFGLVDDDGKIVFQTRKKTRLTVSEGLSDIMDGIETVISSKNLEIKDIRGIGVGCPGAVDSDKGVIICLPNLNWQNVELAKEIKKHFNTPVKLSNDANVAALGEVVYGCAKGYDTAIMFTLGTGVGGGIIINKKLFEGWQSRGAELGHMTLILDGEPCTCGRNGCVERYVSATALIAQTKAEMLKNKDSLMWKFVNGDINAVDGRTAFECSKQGDESAAKVVDTYVKYLSESILNMFNIFRPEVFILGGGVSAQGEYLNEKVRAYCEKFDYGYKDAPRTKIVTATLGNDAGIIGAAALLR